MPVDPMRGEPMAPEAPMPPAAEAPETPELPLEKPSKPESPTRLAELANKLYDAATKMQRDAEALMNAIKDEEGEAEAVEPMTAEESDAANKALIGL